jgi:chromosomal replication initiator protein
MNYIYQVMAQSDMIINANDEVKRNHIVSAVANHYGVTVADMKSPSRKREFVMARQMAMYIIRVCTSYSLKQIGEHFGGRDHSTVLHATDYITNMPKHDHQYKDISFFLNKFNLYKK